MTDDDRRREPADDDELADSFDIDETADENPARASCRPPTSAASEVDLTKQPAERAAEPTDPRPPRQESDRRSRRERRKHRKAPWWELPALIGLAIVIAILVKTFLVQPFYIPSESMEKTLHGCPGCSGDRILVSKIVYDFRDPHPGDIVVFNAPPGLGRRAAIGAAEQPGAARRPRLRPADRLRPARRHGAGQARDRRSAGRASRATRTATSSSARRHVGSVAQARRDLRLRDRSATRARSSGRSPCPRAGCG